MVIESILVKALILGIQPITDQGFKNLQCFDIGARTQFPDYGHKKSGLLIMEPAFLDSFLSHARVRHAENILSGFGSGDTCLRSEMSLLAFYDVVSVQDGGKADEFILNIFIMVYVNTL